MIQRELLSHLLPLDGARGALLGLGLPHPLCCRGHPYFLNVQGYHSKRGVPRVGWARGLAVMTPRLHRVDRGFDSHRAHHTRIAGTAQRFRVIEFNKAIIEI